MPSTTELIETAIERFQADVPALAKLKLVFELELRGRGDVQLFRVEVPGPKISKEMADDAKVMVEIQRQTSTSSPPRAWRRTTSAPTRRARSRRRAIPASRS